MCNLYNIGRPSTDLGIELQAFYQLKFDFPELVVPKAQAPGLLLNDQQREIAPMRFGLIPPGSDPAKVKRPYNNATIEKLSSWPWKLSVGRSRCIIPMTSFLEFSYWGDEYQGHKLEFFPRDESLLLVAGIYNQSNSDVSMTLITRPANSQMMDCGHHRMPMFVNQNSMDQWLDREKQTIDACHEILRHSVAEPEFDIEDHGLMRDGWQKRVDAAIEKRDRQIDAIEQFGPLGIDC